MRDRGVLAVAACLVLLPTVLSACSASKSTSGVTVASGRITIHGQGVTATVQMDPFGLSVGGTTGAADLAEVANRLPAASPLAPLIDPVPPGTDAPQSGQLYAPLSFLVGTLHVQQWTSKDMGGLGQEWLGDLHSGTRSGVQYSAVKVLSEHPSGSGVKLTVSTDDPSGRKLEVSIRPAKNRLLHVVVTPVPAAGVVMMSDSFASSSSEAFYGFGGRHNALNQHGNVLDDWVAEENVPNLGTRGTPSGVLYPNGPTAAYYPQAQFVSSKGYGFFLDQPQLSWFRLDSDRPDAWSVAVAADSLDYYVAPGKPTAAIADLTALTGRQPAPPPSSSTSSSSTSSSTSSSSASSTSSSASCSASATAAYCASRASWELGPMLDREVKNFGETVSTYDAEMKADIADIQKYHLPLTAYRIEGFGFGTPDDDGFVIPTRDDFSVQQKVVSQLRAMHIHPLAYIRPWVSASSVPVREGLVAKTATGQPYFISGTLGQKIAILDFTNPKAVAWWKSELDKIFNLGFDGFEQDFGENVMDDMHFSDGQTGATMHNDYPVLYMKATRDAIAAYEKSHPDRQLWFDNRAGFSGAPGSAAYESTNFPGDEATDWSQASGLAAQTEDMLSRAVGGAYGYGTDIGGYSGYTTPRTTKELLIRWAEWAALTPVFRLHGSGFYGLHTPWSYDQQTVQIYDALSSLHEAAAPLIMALWKEADATGIPPTRPLWLEFPGDQKAAAQMQEWTLGDNVLVAPVVTQGATSRSVYFPKGCWKDPRTGLTEQGPKSATVAAPLATLPYFFRCGTQPFKA